MITVRMVEERNNNWRMFTEEIEPKDCARMIVIFCTLEDDFEVFRDVDLEPYQLKHIMNLIKNAP